MAKGAAFDQEASSGSSLISAAVGPPLAHWSDQNKFLVGTVMRARFLLLALVLGFCSCNKPEGSREQSSVDSQGRKLSREAARTVYLLRRVAVTTQDSLWGFDEGAEATIVEERSGKLLVQVQGMQFELSRQDVTTDPHLRDTLVAQAAERREAQRMAMLQAEDQRFLAEEDARRRSVTEAKIAQLRSAIASARAEILRLEILSDEPDLPWENQPLLRLSDEITDDPEDADPSTEESERQQRLAALRDHIANWKSEIETLSGIPASEETLDRATDLQAPPTIAQ